MTKIPLLSVHDASTPYWRKVPLAEEKIYAAKEG
jgi:hypothetical protein